MLKMTMMTHDDNGSCADDDRCVDVLLGFSLQLCALTAEARNSSADVI